MTSNMDLTVTIQGTKLRGITPKSMRVVWCINDDVMVCCVMNGGSIVSSVGSKIQLDLGVQKESEKMVAHMSKTKL